MYTDRCLGPVARSTPEKTNNVDNCNIKSRRAIIASPTLKELVTMVLGNARCKCGDKLPGEDPVALTHGRSTFLVIYHIIEIMQLFEKQGEILVRHIIIEARHLLLQSAMSIFVVFGCVFQLNKTNC